MRVKFLKDEIISLGPQRVFKGQELELPDGLAQDLIKQGIAEPIAVAPALPSILITAKPKRIRKEK